MVTRTDGAESVVVDLTIKAKICHARHLRAFWKTVSVVAKEVEAVPPKRGDHMLDVPANVRYYYLPRPTMKTKIGFVEAAEEHSGYEGAVAQRKCPVGMSCQENYQTH